MNTPKIQITTIPAPKTIEDVPRYTLALSRELERVMFELSKILNGYEKLMSASESGISTLGNRIDTLESGVSTLGSSISTLESGVSTLGDSIASLEDRMDALEAAYPY